MWSDDSPSSNPATVDFLEGSALPWTASRRETLCLLVPHQISPIEGKTLHEDNPLDIPRCSVLCSCQKGYRGLFERQARPTTGGRQSAMKWIDLRGVPTTCLLTVIYDAIGEVRSDSDRYLGVIIPRGSGPAATSPDCTAEGDLVVFREPPARSRRVWYPSLDLDPSLLQRAAAIIQPNEIFPIVEFPPIEILGSETSLTRQMDVLEGLHVRTERVVHLNPRVPDSTFGILAKSFRSLPKGGTHPRVAILTPGGKAPTVASSLLAGALNDATVVEPEGTLFPSERSDIWGFAVVRRRT